MRASGSKLLWPSMELEKMGRTFQTLILSNFVYGEVFYWSRRLSSQTSDTVLEHVIILDFGWICVWEKFLCSFNVLETGKLWLAVTWAE